MSEQGYAIELYFDPALENQVLKAWNVLARRQINTHLIDMESRPHITLFSSSPSSSSSFDPSKVESIVKSFASKHDPLPLSFSSIASLPSNSNLLFLSPTPTLSLLHFQSQLCDDVPPTTPWILGSLFAPSPKQVPKPRMAEAFCLLRDLKLPVAGYAVDIGLVEFSPVRELFSFVLGNPAESS